MLDLIRDAPAGQLIRWITNNKVLLYPEELPGFDIISHGLAAPAAAIPAASVQEQDSDSTRKSLSPSADNSSTSEEHNEKPAAAAATSTVTWYSESDPANPQCWSLGKKCFVHLLICLLTFTIYSASSIITPAETTFREEWGVSGQASLLVLSMYVLGYSTGPMVFSPLSEIPVLGRNTPYILSFTLFLILSIPAALVNNYPGLVVLRFLQGFFGGPVLATGGASAGDIFSFPKLPYAIAIWVFAAYGGPALGPVISVFAIQNLSWRWAMYIILIAAGFTWSLMLLFMPETNPETILLARAKRLRRLTQRSDLQSDSEKKQANLQWGGILARCLIIPFQVPLRDPAIFFTDLYTALVYGIYYSFFESFPVAYMGVYGFSIESMSLVFITLIISCAIGVVVYCLLVYFIYEPYTIANGIGVPEYRLVPGVYAAALLPVGLFLFGWATQPYIHWAVPTIGLLIFPACAFVLIQVILLYLPTSYPRFAASILGGNTFLRGAVACGAIHFSQPMFGNLGVGRGNSILGGICVGCFFAFMSLWYFGPKLRARSKFAEAY